jgi:hypothetical protein
MRTQGKISVIISICFVVLTAKPVTAQANNKALEKRIVIHEREVRVDSLLKIFSTQTGVEFSYNPNRINPSKRLVVPAKSNTLSQWLNMFRQTLGVEYKLAGNHIILIDTYKRNNVTTKKIAFKATQQKKVSTPSVLHSTTTPKGKTVAKPMKDQTHEQAVKLQQVSPANNNNRTSTTDVSVSDHNPSPQKDNSATANTEQTDKVVASSDTRVIKLTDESETGKPAPAQVGDNKDAIQITGGYSLHGSGDLKGIVFATEYIHFLTKRFSLNYNLRATINSGKDEYIVNNTIVGTTTDASVRYTTAGVQLGVSAGFSMIKNERHDLKFALGTFGRYQSASNGSDGYSLYNPQTTGVPNFLVGYDNKTPQETIAVGAIFGFQYDFTFGNKLYIGLAPAFQTDTNGDAILQAALAIGRRL